MTVWISESLPVFECTLNKTVYSWYEKKDDLLVSSLIECISRGELFGVSGTHAMLPVECCTIGSKVCILLVGVWSLVAVNCTKAEDLCFAGL